jgi:hypothetical protein
MIDETHLRGLMIEAAEAAPPPGRAAEDLLAALMADAGAGADGDDPDGPTSVVSPIRALRGRAPLLAVAAAAVIALLAVGIGTGLGGDDTISRDRDAATTFDESGTTGGTAGGSDGGLVPSTTVPLFLPATPGADLAVPAPEAAGPLDSYAATADASARSSSGGAAAGGSVAPDAPTGAPLTDSAKVVKTGSLDLQVKKGRFEGTVSSIVARAIGLNGYVAESTTSRSGDAPSGTVVVRVPSASFDDLLADLRKLGKVQSVAQKGTEVGAQYTDLQARLAAVSATRDRLNVVLSKAENVPDILSVQDRITQVQTEIEQLQGQLRLLDDQVSMGTLAVSLSEPGATPVEIKTGDDRTVGSAWRDARHRFGNAIEGVVAWSGSAAAVLVVGLVAAVLATLVWRRSRRYFL